MNDTAHGADPLVLALSARASELTRSDDDTSRQAARIVCWAATDEGAALREMLATLKAKQASARELDEVIESVPVAGDYEAALDRAIAEWRANVVDDGSGRPIVVDELEYIHALAYWIASQRLPSTWSRRPRVERARRLEAVRAASLRLAELLDEPDGPEWPPAIELFDEDRRPVWSGSIPVAVYRSHVANRLRGQRLSGVLRHLAESTERQFRVDDRKAASVPRPETSGAFTRYLAARIGWWLEKNCLLRGLGNESCGLITGLINANRRVLAAEDAEPVTLEQVKEWLRPPRRRAAPQKKAPQ